MEESTTREKVLKKIRAALLNKSADPYPRLDSTGAVFTHSDDDPVVVFSDHLSEAGGKFILCENELEFVEGLLNLSEQHKWRNIYCSDDALSNLLTECEFPHVFETKPQPLEVAVTPCECLVARNGSIVLSTGLGNDVEEAGVLVVCARSSQIAMELKDALHWLTQKYTSLPSAISFITGPEEGGAERNPNEAHSSRQLYIFLIDDKDRRYIESAPDEEAAKKEE